MNFFTQEKQEKIMLGLSVFPILKRIPIEFNEQHDCFIVLIHSLMLEK